MKQFKSIILFFALAFAFISAGAQNVSINVLTQNSGQVNIGGTVFVQITIANTSTVTSVPNYKLRPQLSVPVSIVSIPATGHILPAGWSIISNASGVIRVSNGTDQIPPSTSRDIFIAIQGNTLGGPQTVSGNLLFSNGVAPGSASGPATSGDQPGDNSSSSTVEVIQGPACSIAVSASAGTIACNGGTTTLTATATGASGSVEYSLNGGAFQPGNTFTVNAAGSPYTVTAREVATPACTATSAAVTVSEPSAISASASAGSIACNGGTTTLTVTATGGTGSLQYSLSGGAFQGGNTFTVNAAGSPYIVTVQDANNCTVTTSAITVSEPLALSATATSTPVTTTGGSDGTATALPVGGTSPYSYLWTPGNQTTITATGLMAGNYSVLVTDFNGCTATANTTVGSPACTIAVSASAGSILCNGGTTTLTATATGASGAVEYSLNGGAYQPGNTFTVNAAGSPYTVTAREVSNPACAATSTAVTVSQPSVLSATASSTPVTTTGGSDGTATALPVGGTSPYSYLWTPGNQTTITATGLMAGNYSVLVTDFNGCTATANATVGSPACAISVSASAGSILCNGGTTTLTATATGASGAVEYSLNGGAYQPGNTFTVNAAGSPYTVTAREISNPSCSATSSAVTVNEPALLTVSGSVTTPIAIAGGTGTITVSVAGGTGAVSYVVTTGTTVNTTGAASGVFTGLLAGAYTFTATDANGCTATTTAIVLIEPGTLPLTATFVKTNVSACNNTNSDGTITVTANGGTPPYTYAWTGLAGTGNANQVPYTGPNQPALTGLTYGFYNVVITDLNLNTFTISGIQIEGAYTVFVTNNGSISSSCGNPTGSILLYGNAGIRPYTYSLDGITYQAGNTFTNLAAGTYTGYIKDAAGCVGTKPNIVIGTAAPLVVLPYVRQANSCNADGVIEIYRTGGIGPYTYSLDGITYQSSNIYPGLAAGPYTAYVKDSKNCVSSVAVTVTQGAALTVTANKSNASTCTPDGSIQVNVSGGVYPYQYSLDAGTTYQSSNVFLGLAAGNYVVTVKDFKNCTGTVNVAINNNTIVVTSYVVNATSCAGNNGSIQLFRTGGFGPYMYSLDGNIYQATSVFSNLAPGSYTGYVKDSKNCVGQLTGIVVGPTGCGLNIVSKSTSGSIIDAVNSTLKIQAYPNPSNSEFNLVLAGYNSSEKVTVTVTDLLGRIVYQTNGTAKLQFRFGSNLIAGMYNVQVIQGKEVKSLKLIKE